jgi:hypothetical protein
MPPTNRQEFKEYVMRRLGAPVTEINVAEEQVEDRIDDALALFCDRHFDGSDEVFFKHQVTDQDKVNGYITVPDNIVGVMEIFPLFSSGGRTGDIFDIQYQIALNDLYNITTVSMVPYVMTMTHLATLNELLVGRVPMHYTKSLDRVTLDTDWNKIATGSYLLFRAYQVIDPVQFTGVWKDRWLLAYATALVKQQWGTNLQKLVGIQLAGGVTLNGEVIYQQAENELQRLDEELTARYFFPPLDCIG